MSKNNLQGNVYIVRHLADGTELPLTYRPKDEFDFWVANNNDNALGHFTLDDNNNLYIANVTTSSVDYTYKGYSSGEKESDSETTTISTVSIPYQEMIRKYSIPFEFLVPLLTITEDAKFCSDLANEILEKTVITLGIYDNETTIINEYHEVVDQDLEKRYNAIVEYTYNDKDGNEYTTDMSYNAFKDYDTDQKEKTEVFTTTTTTNIIGLDGAYTLFFDMKQSYVKVDLPDDVFKDGPTKTEESKNDLVKGATSWSSPTVESAIEKEFKDLYKNIYPENTLKKADVKTTNPGTYYTTYLVKETTTADNTTTTKKMKYEEDSDPANSYVKFKGKDATDGFYQRFIQDDDETKHTRSCIFEVKDRLFMMLEENLPNPENYINIMKYIFYLFTGVDYGVTDISALLDLYKADSFITLGSGGLRAGGSGGSGYEQFKRWVRSYEGHEGLSADGTKYRVGSVGGNRTVGYGIDLDASGLEPEIKAAAGITGSINVGDYIDVAIIDKFEDQELQAHIDYVRKKTAGLDLEEYQIYALASRAYNCGDYGALDKVRNGKTFNQAYSSYWDKSKNAYGETPTAPYNDKLYTEYMSMPATGSGLDISKRRVTEWKLFKYGYYDSLDEYYMGGNTASIEGLDLYNADGSVNKAKIAELEAILSQEVATRSGAYMNSPQNTYTYLQCTWWAQSRASEFLGYKYPVRKASGNNGKTWYDTNISAGAFEYGSEPRANSLVCWDNPSAGGYGHVAYVEAVDPVNQKIYISHASSGNSFKGIKEIPYSGYFDHVYPIGYIYLDSPKK